jgi:hypothetical protein
VNYQRLMTLDVLVAPLQKIGLVPHGTRATAPITSGTFEGPRLRGTVLPGGGDWTLLRADGVLELDLRLTLRTDDGALIHMTSFGLRHGPQDVIAALGRGETVDPWLPGVARRRSEQADRRRFDETVFQLPLPTKANDYVFSTYLQ